MDNLLGGLGFDLMTVALLIVEFLLGATIGFTLKLITRAKAESSNCVRVISAQDYGSQKFGTDFPQNGLDPFLLSTEFIAVKSLNDGVTSERFYTFLGSFCEAVYVSGQYRGMEYPILSSPLYLCTVFLPIVVGFFALFLPSAGGDINPLLCSGVIWLGLSIWLKLARIWNIFS